VERLIRAEGFSSVRRSQVTFFDAHDGPETRAQPGLSEIGNPGQLDKKVRIVLGDSLGEMASYYAAADLAIMGGSFEKLGGHNLIEACACGCPVILGPHMFNFAMASKEALHSGAAWQVSTAQEAIQKALGLLAGDAQVLAAASRACTMFSQQHRGATDRTLAALTAILPQR
jgi:3-deoxy-D-manno-octulosonic-acid transferase